VLTVHSDHESEELLIGYLEMSSVSGSSSIDDGSRLDDGTVGEVDLMRRHISDFDARQDSLTQRLGDDVVESRRGERVVAACEGASSAGKTDLVLLP
jgi:hypothetical protein